MYKPSDKEEEYFKRQELAKLRKMREEAARAMEQKELKRLKELHWMRCPKCGMALEEIEYRGVKVDTCLGCGGMFLDKGEVEKIIATEDRGILARLGSLLFTSEQSVD